MQPNQGFIGNAEQFYQIARNAYHQAKQDFDDHRQNNALVAIVFSALSLEAFINELGGLASDAKAQGNSEGFLDKLIDAIDESRIQHKKDKTTQAKFLNASIALSQEFDEGESSYQEFSLLFKLRDYLVHLKPERFEVKANGDWTYIEEKLIDELRSRKILSNKDGSLTSRISNPNAAKWACDTVAKMVTATLDRIADSKFSRDNSVLAWYRSMFQTIEEDQRKILEQECHKRTLVVKQVDELRTRLLNTYGEFPDSVELIREDRSR